jgi:DNA-binding CsgD family transcriptional regulator
MSSLPSRREITSSSSANEDDPASAALIAHLVAHMRRLPRTHAPESFLARGIAEYTSQQLCLLSITSDPRDVLAIPLEHAYIVSVQYAQVCYGKLIALTDSAYARSPSSVAHIADTCAWLIHGAQCEMVLQGFDIAQIEPLRRKIAHLSKKKREVLKILTRGGSIAEMAQEAQITPGTFNSHLGQIYHTLEVKRQRDAIVQGIIAQLFGLL